MLYIHFLCQTSTKTGEFDAFTTDFRTFAK